MTGPGVTVCVDAVDEDAVVGAGAIVGYIVSKLKIEMPCITWKKLGQEVGKLSKLIFPTQ